MKKSLFFGLLFLSVITLAQPNEAYINQLTGRIDSNWMQVVGNNLVYQPLNWVCVQVPGYKTNSYDTRKRAFIKQNWTFFENNSENKPEKNYEVKMPHSFGTKHTFKSGWYFIKLNLEKKANKKYFILLERVQCFGMLFVNGKRCRHHFGAYTPFETDITDFINSGSNYLTVFVKDISAITVGNKLYSQIGVKGAYLNGGILEVPILEERSSHYLKDVFVKTSTRKMELEIEFEFPTINTEESTLNFEIFHWPNGEKVELNLPTVYINKETKLKDCCKIKWENPKLWSPDKPNLYVLKTSLKKGNSVDVVETRFGFREFWIEGKSFYLNGFPIRLRGDGIYGIHNDSLELHRKIIEDQKRLFGTNTLRMHHEIPIKAVIMAADEAGILLDNQSSIWSSSAADYKNGGEWFIGNMETEFEEWVRRDRNSPSVVIWDLENEMLRVSFTEHLPWVDKLAPFVLRHDNTRPLNNSGAGWFSPFQHMAWLHMQEHYTKIISDWQAKGTSPLVIGEFWIGGRADFNRMPHSPEYIYPRQKNDERAISFHDKILEMRYLGVSGIMPFKFYSSFKKPASKFSQQLVRKAIQPVTAFVWPRQKYNESGKTIEREIVVCNDSETADNFEVIWAYGKEIQTKTIFLKQAEQKRIQLLLKPLEKVEQIKTAIYKNQVLIATDTLQIHPIEVKIPSKTNQILVYKNENVAAKLAELGLKAISVNNIPKANEAAIFAIPNQLNNTEIDRMREQVLDFVSQGGKILSFKQEQSPNWLPATFPLWSAYQSGKHNYALMDWKGLNTDLFYANEVPIYAQSHPIFKGISSLPLHLWDQFDGRVSDHVFTRPSNINKFEHGAWRPLSGGTRMEHISLAEFFYGKGLILACQLNLLENSENPQAKVLLYNTIEHLSKIKNTDASTKIALRGNIDKNEMIKNLHIAEADFENAKPKSDIMIASPGTDLEEVKAWAKSGGKVIVFSSALSQKFESILVDSNKVNQVSKLADNQLFYGISSYNFNKSNFANVKGVFIKIPSFAHEILRGFTSDSTFGAVAISMPYQKGEIILTTMELDSLSKVKMQELTSLILCNCGVKIPFKLDKQEEILIKKTVPITIDGKLNEWVEDMEDRLVTRYIHANPVYLTSKNIVAGPPEFDLNLSAINYFMSDKDALYISGVVFSEERTWESGITPGTKKEYLQNIILNNDTLSISYNDNVATLTLNNNVYSDILIKTGRVNSSTLTDARILQFSYIYKSGETLTESQLTGETFELRIPFEHMKLKPTDSIKALLTIEAKGSKLQVPFMASPNSKDKWLKMNFE